MYSCNLWTKQVVIILQIGLGTCIALWAVSCEPTKAYCMVGSTTINANLSVLLCTLIYDCKYVPNA